jgi:short-subunit dehydrogenase
VLEYGPFAGMTPETHRRMIELNVGALTQMLAHFVPPMVERGRGRVLNVASVAAFQPIPSLATYAATKAYVLSLTESLSEELRGSGVTVTALCPGITATAMLAAATSGNPQLGRLPGMLVGSAQDVADEGYEACLRGETVRVPGLLNLAGTLASRAAPRWLVRRVGGALARRVG